MTKKLSILLFWGLVVFTIWRNYGVVAKGDKVDLTNPKTNEEKQLYDKVKDMQPKEGDEVLTSFGYYQYKSKDWIKVKEVWE
jgi:hypothetical protein